MVLLAALIALSDSRPPTTTQKLVMLGRSPAFHATVDGHDAILELDTGSFELRLSPAFVQRNSIPISSVKLKIGDAPEESCKPIIEGLAETDQPTLADRFAVRADGIVGLDVLRKYAVGLDLVGKEVSFWSGGKVADTADSWTALPLEPDSPQMASLNLTTRNDLDWFRVQTRVNGRPLDFVFDTGTAFSTLNPTLATQLQLKRVADTEVEEIGHTEVLPIVEAKEITFGSMSAVFPILNVEAVDDAESDGILGSESLGQGKFLIDMPDKKLYMRRAKTLNYANPLEKRLRAAGLDVFPDSKDRLLVIVEPGGLAQRAGVQSGYFVVSLGNVKVEDLEQALSHPSPALVQIGMELLKKDLQITVERADGSKITIDLPQG